MPWKPGERPARRRRKGQLPYRLCHYDHKRSWTSRKLADEAAAVIRRQGQEHARVYWCVAAGAWHVTTSPPGEYDRRQVLSNRRGGMTDKAIAETIKAIDDFGSPGWAKKLEVQEVKLQCHCGEPIRVTLGGAVRELRAGTHDPAAELVTLTVEIEHHGEHKHHGLATYVVKSGEPQLDNLEPSEHEHDVERQDQPAEHGE